jgi:hypothetical protein
MQEERYITRRVNGEQRLLDAEHLLADWRASYDFFRQNEVIRGHVPARTNEELLETISNRLFYERVRDYAFTGLASAWLHTQFVAFRLVTVYLKRPPSEDMLRVMQFREEPRGANVWLAIPKDDGVFMGAEEISGIPCVSRVQTYLDLKDQPERSDEAAEELYRSLSLGKQNG